MTTDQPTTSADKITDGEAQARIDAADLAARRREALRSRARIAGDYSAEAQAALGVCNDGTPGDDGLTAEGERYADSIIASLTDDPADVPAATMDEVKGEMREARRRLALRYYVAVDGEPFTAEECAGYGVTPAGHIAESGLTDQGVEFAELVAKYMDEKFGTPGVAAAFGKRGPTNAVAGLVDAFGLREPFRIALAAHLGHEHGDDDDDGLDEPASGVPVSFGEAMCHMTRARAAGKAPTVGFDVLGGEDLPAEMRERLAETLAEMFGGAEVVDLARPSGNGNGRAASDERPSTLADVDGSGGGASTEYPARGPVPDDAGSGAPGRSTFGESFSTPTGPSGNHGTSGAGGQASDPSGSVSAPADSPAGSSGSE